MTSTPSPALERWFTRCLVALLCAFLFAPAAAQAQARLDVLQSLLSTEKALAAEAQRRYLAEREQQADAELVAEGAIEALDSLLSQEPDAASAIPPLAELERLQIQIEASVVAADYSAAQTRQARQRLYDHWRRIDALERQVRGLLGGGSFDDPITGRWQVRIASPPSDAVFVLHLNGTLVSGTFAIEEGAAGSLRGTYAGGQLRLERIDATGGVAGVYRGTVDPSSSRASGLWSPSELSDGGPGLTGWSAERGLPADDEEFNPPAAGTGADNGAVNGTALESGSLQ